MPWRIIRNLGASRPLVNATPRSLRRHTGWIMENRASLAPAGFKFRSIRPVWSRYVIAAHLSPASAVLIFVIKTGNIYRAVPAGPSIQFRLNLIFRVFIQILRPSLWRLSQYNKHKGTLSIQPVCCLREDMNKHSTKDITHNGNTKVFHQYHNWERIRQCKLHYGIKY